MADGDGGLELSDLPNDILAYILDQLKDTRAAARTSVLSRRWRNLWARIPRLFFRNHQPHDSSHVSDALAAHAAHAVSAITQLTVMSLYSATPDATASWLCVAAPLISGELRFRNRSMVTISTLIQELGEEVVEERGVFELPCFPKATVIRLSLGFLGLSLPPSGVFSAQPALRKLHLEYVQFHGECTLDDGMMPFLKELVIFRVRGLANLTVKLKSLIQMFLWEILDLVRLNAVVPGLKNLCVSLSLRRWNLPSVRIVAEEVEDFSWGTWYDPGFVEFSEMPYLRMVTPPYVFPYGEHKVELNQNCQRFLRHFSRIHSLMLLVKFTPGLGDVWPLMEGITRLPDITILYLHLVARRHAYGASVLHILAMCTGISKLILQIQADFEGGIPCSLNCICHQPPSQGAQNVVLMCLEEVEIKNFNGKKHELDFVKVLFKAAPELRRMRFSTNLVDVEKISSLPESFDDSVEREFSDCDLSDTESKMEGITSLPNIEILSLVLFSHGHVIGASVLYLLRMCTGIRELSLKLPENSEVLNTCPLNCICDQKPNWRDEHILMKFLREAEILNFRGKGHEVDLVKLLLRAAPGLRRLRITCHRYFAAWERLSEYLQRLAGHHSKLRSVEVSQVMTPLQP
ncbi:hypothetical protein GUJ93_ZPchr0007g4062 [Zizania palustris]|uniref:F-box domain-containing protein n=1 Tax=Zizania palustris TaxID=103762 RepID=A0A8J5T5H0_ZIZPA|nr:hypothetical protein GUJ93_ZPchr0007g4062 [Zizania palustris]